MSEPMPAALKHETFRVYRGRSAHVVSRTERTKNGALVYVGHCGAREVAGSNRDVVRADVAYPMCRLCERIEQAIAAGEGAGEMSGATVPARAWTQYDRWADFHWIPEPRGQKRWERYSVPSDGLGVPSVSVSTYATLVDSIRTGADLKDAGPLRSVRVLLSSGHEVCMGFIASLRSWELYLAPGDRDSVAIGWCKGATDTEAVQRALDAAIQWVEEHGHG